jgi:DNA-binding PadR family transcriptional regulator
MYRYDTSNDEIDRPDRAWSSHLAASHRGFLMLELALSRLERSGAVEGTEDLGRSTAPPVPMTGSLSGERAALRARRSGTGLGRRSRKVYRITDEGRRQFAELLHSEQVGGNDEARNFSLRLAFARYLPPHARMRLLERRRGQLFQRLAESRAAVDSAGGRLDTYARSLMEHTTESTERDIAWLDRLIEAERAKEASAAGVVGPALVGTKTVQTVLEEGDTK